MIEHLLPVAEVSWPTHGNAEEARLPLIRLRAAHHEMSERQRHMALSLHPRETRYVLRGLRDMGVVKVENSRRGDKTVACAYLLRPKRLNYKPRMTREFLACKKSEFEHLQATITQRGHEVDPWASNGGREPKSRP